ncbi:hypothetical protein [Nocardia arthritidis]|uniref:Uncharacterized protein n=1 Tax=Nocardia arthritidis TaxID=228602 RepID=A0A6G9YTD8_9NOCA|nr:hypothetical protein [Nocardia arthritidis]QIS16589.1 hypothetical protein F5544_43930 [Nocardia arthritidis]
MTSPDKVIPEGSYSGRGGQSGVRNVAKYNENSAKAAMTGGVLRSYTGVQVNMGKFMEAGFDLFAANLCDAITGFTGGLIDLSGWARQLRKDAEKAMQDARGAQQSADTAQQTADNQTPIIKSTNSKVQVVIDGLPLRPYWETLNLTEESSFPRHLLHYGVWDASTTPVAGYTEYDIQVGSAGAGALYLNMSPNYTPPANTLEATFIRCLYDGPRQVVTYIPDAVAGDPCELYVVVGRLLDTGNIKIEWVSDNQTPNITKSRFERSITMPKEIVFATGDTAFIGIQQRGSGVPRPLMAVASAEIPRAADVWPPRLKARFASGAVLTAGSVIANGSFDFTGTMVPYVSLGRAIVTGPPRKLVLFEDFENGMPSTLARMSSTYATVEGGVFVVWGGTDGIRRYIYARNLNYDDQMVSGRVRGPATQAGLLMVRSDATNSSYVALAVGSKGAGLLRFVNGETYSQLAVTTTPVADNDEVRVKAVGNVFTAERKINGTWTQFLSYTDTDKVLPTGPAYRYTGLGLSRASWVNSNGWDYWKAEDL